MSSHFGDRLCKAVKAKSTPLIVGLDPVYGRLPEEIRAVLGIEQVVRMPMLPGSRSLNLSNSAAIVVYEAWRQHGFKGAI